MLPMIFHRLMWTHFFDNTLVIRLYHQFLSQPVYHLIQHLSNYTDFGEPYMSNAPKKYNTIIPTPMQKTSFAKLKIIKRYNEF